MGRPKPGPCPEPRPRRRSQRRATSSAWATWRCGRAPSTPRSSRASPTGAGSRRRRGESARERAGRGGFPPRFQPEGGRCRSWGFPPHSVLRAIRLRSIMMIMIAPRRCDLLRKVAQPPFKALCPCVEALPRAFDLLPRRILLGGDLLRPLHPLGAVEPAQRAKEDALQQLEEGGRFGKASQPPGEADEREQPHHDGHARRDARAHPVRAKRRSRAFHALAGASRKA